VANIVKIAVNYNIIHALQALGESIAMVEEHGVDANEFVDVLHATLFGGVVHGGYGPMIANRAYRPAGFTLGLGQKDLLLADGIAREAGLELATLPALIRVFQQALADPALAQCDWSAIAEVSRRSPRP
jgi:3-hydroxyisobutyrate dehydrogenase-like beta-hydroxyacid dehydrogenase